LPGMPEKRADVMVAGSLILHRVLEKLGFDKLTVSTKGVRYGLALQAYKQASQ
jgi:exopolyphosphatase/pppGpp-phosphohydrolase